MAEIHICDKCKQVIYDSNNLTDVRIHRNSIFKNFELCNNCAIRVISYCDDEFKEYFKCY